MKHLLLLSAAFLMACSAAVETESPPAKTETVTAASLEKSSTSTRFFEQLKSPSILIFSETRDWRHEEGIASATLAIIKIANEMGLSYFSTEHSAIFNAEELAKFDVVVFNNMTGDALTPTQEAAFETWLAQGKGTVLIHGAGDSSHQDWDFYHNNLLGATFTSHPADPQFQDARVEVLNTAL